MRPEAERLERLAERLRAVEPAVPAPAAKIRGWNLAGAAVQQSAHVRARTRSVGRLALAGVAAAVLLLLGGFAASADSLPDSALYPLKGVLESARGTLAFGPGDQFTYHLSLARVRLTEAQAMLARHRVDLADRSLTGLADQLSAAALAVRTVKQADPALARGLDQHLRDAVSNDDHQLAALLTQAPNPAAVTVISRARDRAQTALQLAGPPVTTNPSPSPSASASPSGSPESSASASPSVSAAQSP